MNYSQKEVGQLLEKLFLISAKEINQKLITVEEGRAVAFKRWFWELLQNAKDAVKRQEKVSVVLRYSLEGSNPFIEFLHNGNPFRFADTQNLILPYSDKADKVDEAEVGANDKSGRFGTGFLATHVLSKKIKVEGIFKEEDDDENDAYKFHFTLDRTGGEDIENKTLLAEKIRKTYEEFRTNQEKIPDYQYSPSNPPETRFTYELDGDIIEDAEESINEIQKILPFVISFIPKLKTITFIDLINSTTFIYQRNNKEQKLLTDNIIRHTIDKFSGSLDGEPIEKTYILISSDSTLEVGIEVIREEEEDEEGWRIKAFSKNHPMLFYPFPLIGENTLRLPIAIKSNEFTPKEERDGLYLNDTISGTPNQKILERSVALFKKVVEYASSHNYKNPYLFLKSLKETQNIPDFNSKWFKESVQNPMKTFLMGVPLVDNEIRGRVPIISSDGNIYFASDLDEQRRSTLWEFLNVVFPKFVTKDGKDINRWYSVIWEGCPTHSIETFVKFLSALKNIHNLSQTIGKTKEETIDWLNEFITFLYQEEFPYLNKQDYKIIPNQYGTFCCENELYFDDKSIDNELKDILRDLCKFRKGLTDWRNELIEIGIKVDFPENRTRNLQKISPIIIENVRELLKEENPIKEVKDLFSNVLNWMNDNPEKAKEHFKGLKTDTLLYKTADERKIKALTDLLQRDRDGSITLEEVANLSPQKIQLLHDPDLELKIRLGEEVLKEMREEKEEFDRKKSIGDLFESLFLEIIESDDRLSIQKVEGEEDFIITNNFTNQQFYIELKSVKRGVSYIQITHRQAKKAYRVSSNYILCIIPNDPSSVIDQEYFVRNAKFDKAIGKKLTEKVKAAIDFESPQTGITVHFEDDLLGSYKKCRYKFHIQNTIWGQEDFKEFLRNLGVDDNLAN